MVVLVPKLPCLNSSASPKKLFVSKNTFCQTTVEIYSMAYPHTWSVLYQRKKPKKRGRSSGGLATLISGHINTDLFASSDHFLAVRVGETVIINVYLPTDYRDDCSKMKFALACKELGKCMNKISASHLHWILLGDFNCDISKSESSRSALLLIV